jgi:PAS domain-containing protein
MVAGRVIGVMALFARHPLSDGTISALASVADHVALGAERHRSAAALRTTEERMRFALQNADVGIWDMDYTTGVLRWSETSEAHYGVPPGTFRGTFEAFVERIHPDDRAALLETIGKAARSGSDFSVQLAHLNETIQLQRLRVFKATRTTVQDIVNNLLNGFQLVRIEGEECLPAETLTLVDEMIQQASIKLHTLADLETVNEKEMTIGMGIDYPGATF